MPTDWRFEVSDNGWTNDAIGLNWLQKTFIPSTTSRKKGRYRLLILDSHGSHVLAEFDTICSQNDIIPICMPSHSSHLLQPLDTGYFAGLEKAYSDLVDSQVKLSISRIDKCDFLAAYPRARKVAFKSQTIINSFAAAGLVPFDPIRVVSKLDIRLHTPPLPPSRGSDSSLNFTPKTPRTVKDVRRQASSIKKLQQESPSRADKAFK